jgi:hypothetical protein
LILFVITLYLSDGEDGFMYGDYGEAWVMLKSRYPETAVDFAHSVRSNLITWVGVCLYSLAIITFPFKNKEGWAWFALWILPAVLIEDVMFAIKKQTGLQYWYGGHILLAVLGLLISFRAYFPRESD